MKKLKPIYPNLIILAIASLVMNSCNFIDCIDGNGNIVTESRLVSEFHSVENTTNIDVEIIADTMFSVEVTADENLLQFIDTYVRGGNLVIDTDYSHCFNNSSGNPRVEIHMPTIKTLESSGSGDIDLFDLDVEELTVLSSGSGDVDLMNIYATDKIIIESSGSGDISVSGKSIIGDYMLSGSGDIWADDLRVDECYVYSTGSGDVYCYVYDKLDVTIKGSGDVYFEGPIEDRDIHEYNTGSGELRKR